MAAVIATQSTAFAGETVPTEKESSLAEKEGQPQEAENKETSGTENPAITETESKPEETEAPGETETSNETETKTESTENASLEGTESGALEPEKPVAPEETEIPNEAETKTESTENVSLEGTESMAEETEETEAAMIEKSKEQREEKKNLFDKIGDLFHKKAANIVKVSSLEELSQAVAEQSRKEDLTPAYEFTEDSSTAVVSGEETAMSAVSEGDGVDMSVPVEVFAADEAVDEAALSDSGMVEIAEVAQNTDYEVFADEKSVELVDPYASRCLILKGEASKTAVLKAKADTVITGFEDIMLLYYDTPEAAKAAHEVLSEIKGIDVQVDSVIGTNGELTPSEDNVEKPETEAISTGETVPDGFPATVAVIDTGYDVDSYGKERIAGGADYTGGMDIRDKNGHGTALANIILNNTSDVVKVIPVKVADENGRTTALKIFMGLKYAMSQNADVINISMTAYKSAYAGIIEDAVKKAAADGIHVVVSAGNAGEDTSGYTPANIPEAVTVSAVNADKARDVYSNFGDAVDYCAFGSVDAGGLGNQTVTVSGTSVSAAIVSTVFAENISKNKQLSFEEIVSLVDSQAEDLGETGKDIYFGKGLLTFDAIKAKEESKDEKDLPKLLTCDWKNMSVEALNEILRTSDYLTIRRFLDDLDKEDKQLILSMEGILLNQETTSVMVDVGEDGTPGNEKRFTGKLYEYLYSEFFEEFSVQKKVDKDKEINFADKDGGYPGYVARPMIMYGFVDLQRNGKDTARLHVRISGSATTTKPKVSLTATDTKAFDFGSMSVSSDAKEAFEAEKSGSNVMDIWGVYINHIKAKKDAHDKVSVLETKNRPTVSNNHGDGTIFLLRKDSLTSAECNAKEMDVTVLFMDNEEEQSEEHPDKPTTHNIKLTGKSTEKDKDWTVYKKDEPTCTIKGTEYLKKETKCKHCKKVVDTEYSTRDIAALTHNFPAEEAWTYADCGGLQNLDAGKVADGWANIANGMRFHQCTRNCREGVDANGFGWQKDFQYLNQIYVRWEDPTGGFSTGYTYQGPGYVYPNVLVNGWESGVTNDFENVGVAAYYSPSHAVVRYINVKRKTYKAHYNANAPVGAKVSGNTADTLHRAGNWSNEQISVNKFKVTYKLTFNGNDGKVIQLNSEGKKIPQNEVKLNNLKEKITVNTRLEFAGWYYDTSTNSKCPYKDSDRKFTAALSPTNVDVNVYAKWGPGTQPLPDAYEEGYEFIGWSENPDSTKPDPGYEAGKTVPVDENKELFAVYEKIKFTVKYDGNKAPVGSMDPVTVEFGDTLKVAETKFSWDGFSFAGWDENSQKDGLEKECHFQKDNEMIMNTASFLKEENKSFANKDGVNVWEGLQEKVGDLIYYPADRRTITLFATWNPNIEVVNIGNEQFTGFNILDGKDTGYGYEIGGIDPDASDGSGTNGYGEEASSGNNTDVDEVTSEESEHFKKYDEIEVIDSNGESLGMQEIEMTAVAWSFDNKTSPLSPEREKIQFDEMKSARDWYKEAKRNLTPQSPQALTQGKPADDFDILPKSETKSTQAQQDIAKTFGINVSQKGEGLSLQEFAKKGAQPVVPDDEKRLYMNVYAVYDRGPEIEAEDMYFELKLAQQTTDTTGITPEELLYFADATDTEDTHIEKVRNIPDIEDRAPGTTYLTVENYAPTDFSSFLHEGYTTVSYLAVDSAGNETRWTVKAYLVDTTPVYLTGAHNENVRFISAKYYEPAGGIDTLMEDSVWMLDPEYRALLTDVLTSEKVNVEYAADDLPIFGDAFKVVKQGSGQWSHGVDEIWEISNEQIQEMQEYVRNHGIGNFEEPDGLKNFRAQFASCIKSGYGPVAEVADAEE